MFVLRKHAGARVVGGLVALMFGGTALAATELVTVDSTGVEANGYTGAAAVSGDGRFVVFQSSATNLVSNDTNSVDDIFLRDRLLGTTVRVSVGAGGVEANGWSANPTISRDGRYIAYESAATNLAATATNGVYHIYRYDTLSGTTVHVSRTTAGVQGNGSSTYPSISNTGRYISYTSLATNLVTGDTNARPDVFRRDVESNITIRVSVTNAGAQSNITETRASNVTSAISGDGRYVLFRSNASNLVAGDTNTFHDLFVRDVTGATTRRVSLTNTGAQANSPSYMGAISNDGRYVVFSSIATNLVTGDTNVAEDVFVRDRTANTTTRVSVSSSGAQTPTGELGSTKPTVSDDGRYVAFESYAPNLVAGDTNGVSDIFVRDRTLNTTTRVNLSNTGAEGDDYSHVGRITANGTQIEYTSGSTNLVDGGTSGNVNAFVSTR